LCFKLHQGCRPIERRRKPSTGVQIEDQESGEKHEIKGKAIINATGVFTNSIMKLNDTVYKKYIVPSQGIHLVFKSFAKRLCVDDSKTSDGRVLFGALAQQNSSGNNRYRNEKHTYPLL
jgi:glycerol-3-phosphate dehydrogenase